MVSIKNLFIESYLTNRKQRTKIGDSLGKYQIIITGEPHGYLGTPLSQYFYE